MACRRKTQKLEIPEVTCFGPLPYRPSVRLMLFPPLVGSPELERRSCMRRLAGFISAACMVFAVGCAQTDSGITSAVKSKLAADDTVKAYQVNVDTSNHVVTLKGDVNTSVAKERAVQIARNTNGVRDVIDQLRVTDA